MRSPLSLLTLAALLLACTAEIDLAATSPGAGGSSGTGQEGTAGTGQGGDTDAGPGGPSGSSGQAGHPGPPAAGSGGAAGAPGVACPASGEASIVLGQPCDSDKALCGSCDASHTTRYSCDKGRWNEIGCETTGNENTAGLAALAAIDCSEGAACENSNTCTWFRPKPNWPMCVCGEDSTMGCTLYPDVPTPACVEGQACEQDSSCVVSNSVCERECSCQDGVLDCFEHCGEFTCRQGGPCLFGSAPCTVEQGDCTTVCTCQKNGGLDCQVTCPSCPGATPACDDPCELPSGDACLCTRDGQKTPCTCGAPSTGSPFYACCPAYPNQGDSCDGFPEGKVCARGGSEGTCKCLSGVWSSCSF